MPLPEPRVIARPQAKRRARRIVIDRPWLRAYILPVISEGIRLPAYRHGDGLLLKLAGVEVRSLTPIGTIPGVVVLAAAGRNGPGAGLLRASGNGTLLSWRAPGSGRFGSTVLCDSDGNYLLEDGEYVNKWLRVEVHVDYLNAGAIDAHVYLADIYNNGVGNDDVTAPQATAGNVIDYTLTMENASPMDMLDVKAWLEVGTSRTIEISLDDISYYSPTFEDHQDTLAWARIATGATETLYLRRTITAGAGSDPGVLNHLQFAWDGF